MIKVGNFEFKEEDIENSKKTYRNMFYNGSVYLEVRFFNNLEVYTPNDNFAEISFNCKDTNGLNHEIVVSRKGRDFSYGYDKCIIDGKEFKISIRHDLLEHIGSFDYSCPYKIAENLVKEWLENHKTALVFNFVPGKPYFEGDVNVYYSAKECIVEGLSNSTIRNAIRDKESATMLITDALVDFQHRRVIFHPQILWNVREY